MIALPAPGWAAAKRGLCATTTKRVYGPRVAVLSAFPAELAPLVARAQVQSSTQADGRQYYVGRLAGVRVVLGITGIGTVNAATTTESVIRAFAPEAIIMSAVAGSPDRIGDVVIAARWLEVSTQGVFPVNAALLALAMRGANALPEPLHNCTLVPPTAPDAKTICFPFQPEVVFGDLGQSSDPFNGKAFPCTPGGGEIFGCELPAPAASVAATAPDATDMETAAVAHVAADHDVPFIAARAVSDGAGDPLGDRGFPAQFFDYYRLAAENESLMTRATLAVLDGLPHGRGGRAICRLLAHRRWDRAATRIRRSSTG
jgi:nucleoside phosphorylase